MAHTIPNSVIGAVSSVLAEHYQSHSKLNVLLMSAGVPSEPPEGNMETKCSTWFKRCNDDESLNPLAILGFAIQKFMDLSPVNSQIADGQKRLLESLARNQLSYQLNGFITLAGASLATKSLADFFKAGDFASVEAEFNRAVSQLDGDPHAAITAASSIIEALCKTYIETFTLDLPAKQSIAPLWKIVQGHLGLNVDSTLEDDQKKILQGLASIIDGIEAYRTHIGSAHGRGINPPPISVAEARLAVNASHTLVTFLMERWHIKS